MPVVLPLVQIEVRSDSRLEVSIDREQYDVPDTWTRLGRGAVRQVVGDITGRLGCPVRVEVTESDGSVFTDIVAPLGQAQRAINDAPGTDTSFEVTGDGFVPEEQVAVAVIVAHQTADADGTARLRLPPALIASNPGVVVLLGRTSGTVAVSGGGAR